MDRHQFTRPGFHPNTKEKKKKSAKKIVNSIKDILNKTYVNSITMTWKKEHVMDREKKHIPLVNKKQSLEKKKLNQERNFK